MENVAGEQDLAFQQYFPYKTSKFSENSNCSINFLFHSRGLKLGDFGIFDALFPFLVCPLHKIFLGKIWSRDPSCKEPIFISVGTMAVPF